MKTSFMTIALIATLAAGATFATFTSASASQGDNVGNSTVTVDNSNCTDPRKCGIR